MKKILSVLLSIILAFSTTACSINGTETDISDEPVIDSNTVLEIGPEDYTAIYFINLYEK